MHVPAGRFDNYMFQVCEHCFSVSKGLFFASLIYTSGLFRIVTQELEMNLLAQGLHAIAATLWIGGIFFAFMALRPAAQEVLQPRERLHLWRAAYRKFFQLVWVLISILLVTGYYQLFFRFGVCEFAALLASDAYYWADNGRRFFYLYFSLYGRLCRLIDTEDISAASDTLKKMRPVIAANLFLGIVITAVGVCGPYVSV